MLQVVRLKNVNKTYLLGKVEVKALCGINIDIKRGEFVIILGPSGSGKTTLLNLIGTLDTPSSGEIEVNGQKTNQLNSNELAELRTEIGFVFQFFNLIPRLTAMENVELPLVIKKIKRKERRKRANYLLDLVGLGDRVHHKPKELSGGERQRVAIARALANNPRFLLLDEPTGNIDSHTAKELMDLLEKLSKEQNISIIMVTHDHTLKRYSTRAIHFLDGTIIKEEELN